MSRRGLTLLVVSAVALQSSTFALRFTANDEEVGKTSAGRSKAQQHSAAHHPKEWIKGPNGFLYQFHAGTQSWLAAREFCLSQNSDLAILRDKEQIEWLLSHYAPTYARFAERYIQIGLMMPDGANQEWTYLDGSKYNQSVIGWLSGEPFDHSSDGLERCALLRVHARLLDDVDCEATPHSQLPVRFVCERTVEGHKKQLISDNFLWRKMEQLLEYFGFTGSTSPEKPSTNFTDADDNEDYLDEVAKNMSLALHRKLKTTKHDTSSEEERDVLTVLKALGKPGSTTQTQGPETQELTSPAALQEVRPQTSSEILSNESTLSASSTTEEQSPSTTAEDVSTATTEASTTATKAKTTSTVMTTTDVTTTQEEFTSTATESTAAALEKAGDSLKTTDSARAHAAPLREIDEKKSDGAEVERSAIEETPSATEERELNPKKLDEVINTMEKMIQNLEKISTVDGPAKTVDTKKALVLKEEVKKEAVVEKKLDEGKEVPKRKEVKKKENSHDAVTGRPEDGATHSEMEQDFDDELAKKMPTTDIKPPTTDEDCEEGSGERTTTESLSEAVVRNAIDTEDVEDLSQKPKIPIERESHVQEFLSTLRTFLSRAEHNDLRKLLDDNPGKTLLEKMKIAIAVANEREFERMRQLELMKSHGVDISNVPEPELMGDKEREDLFKKISGVVMAEAEKHGVEAATEPSARTTTQETTRVSKPAINNEDKKGVGIWNSKEESKKKTKESEKKVSAEERSMATTGEKHEHESTGEVKQTEESTTPEKKPLQRMRKDVSKSTEELAKEEVMAEKEAVTTTKVETSSEMNQTTTESAGSTSKQPKSAEIPARTVQLKEFENKEEVISKEEKEERLLALLAGEEVPVEKSSERPNKEEDSDVVKMEPIKEEKVEEEKESEIKEIKPYEPEIKEKEKSTEKVDESGGVKQSKSGEQEKKKSNEKENTSKALKQGKSGEDENNSFDSQQVDKSEARARSAAKEELEEEVPITELPNKEEQDEDRGVEVGTEKTPEAKAKEQRRRQKAKADKLRKAKESRKSEQAKKSKPQPIDDDDEEDDEDSDESAERKNSVNPLGLPTLPPPPTLAPLPKLEDVLEDLGNQWRKLFSPPKFL